MSEGVPNLKQQLKLARELGLEVKWLKATGEVMVGLPGEPRLRINGRRKAGHRELQRLIRSLEEG